MAESLWNQAQNLICGTLQKYEFTLGAIHIRVIYIPNPKEHKKMTLSIKKELETTDIKKFLPHHLNHKMLAYLSMKTGDFIDQFSPDDPDNNTKIRIDPCIMDIVTKIYTSLHGDHEIDISNIQNILMLQEKLNTGAIYYSLAIYRESMGRDLKIKYEKPDLDNILTKNPNSYDCRVMFDYIKQNKCSGCSQGVTQIADNC